MSRIGKQPIAIPEKTEVKINDGTVSIKGPLGELSRVFKSEIAIQEKERELIVAPIKENLFTQALWGTYASHLRNMIDGVTKGYEKKLIINGVGYRAEKMDDQLTLKVGFSHLVKVDIPEGIKVEVAKNVITISGIDKELVGRFTAHVRSIKKPEPYKGKGIRYENEVVRRKQGKKAA